MASPGNRSPTSGATDNTLDSLDLSFVREMENVAQVQQDTWNPRIEAQVAINVRFYMLYHGPNYQTSGHQYQCAEYTPRTRLIQFRQDDPFCRKGFPHEVTLPQTSSTMLPSWVPFPYYIHVIARNWSRILPNNQGAPVMIRFTEVLRYRMLKQSRRSLGLFGILERLQAGMLHVDHYRRIENMFLSIRIRMNQGRLESFLELLKSTIIGDPFMDFVAHYLTFNPNTQIPLWDKVQAHLGKDDPSKFYSSYTDQQRQIGLGARNWRAPVNRGNWSVERSACRFILWVYHLLTYPETDEEKMIAFKWTDVSGNWLDVSYVPPLADRYWFGYAILCLLIWSWQYKLQHGRSLTAEQIMMLVPALDGYFQPRPFAFRQFPVGEVDVSPATPWVFEQPLIGDPHFPPHPDERDPYAAAYRDNVSDGGTAIPGDNATVISATSFQSWRSGHEVPRDLIERWAGVPTARGSSVSGSAITHITETELGTPRAAGRGREAGAPSPEAAEAAAMLLSLRDPPPPERGATPITQPEDLSESDLYG